MRPIVCAMALVLSAASASAVHFTGSQTGPTTWTYNLTIDGLDNYSICQTNTTITINGLSGVTAAGPPTSSDVPSTPSFVALQLAWTAQVLNGGTTVVWTHVGPGSGNFGSAFHINGFTITSAGTNGTGAFATSGFARDGTCPTTVLDISGTVAGPAPASTAVPALTPAALALLGVALAVAATIALKR